VERKLEQTPQNQLKEKQNLKSS